MKKPAKPRKRRLSPAEAARIAEIFRRFEAASPNPHTELEYKTPFTLLVSVVLSAQATDKSVNKATEKLFAVADTPQQMLALGEAGLIPFIASIGLFRMKAKNVVALSRILVEQSGGQVPMNRDALQALPGVGRKTASVVLNERPRGRQDPRSPLADPARPLHLPGAKAEMPRVPGRRPVPLAGAVLGGLAARKV